MLRRNNNKHDAVVCIGAGKSQLPLILAGRSMGFLVIAVDRDKTAVGVQHADLNILNSTHDTAAVLAALRSQPSMYAVKGIVARTTAAEALCTAAAVAKEYNIPGLTPEIIRLSTEKSSLRDYCGSQNIPVPTGVKARSTDDIPDNLEFPAIVKPDRTASGKAGILFCRQRKDLLHYFGESAKASDNHCVEIESYVKGIDSSCLCRTQNGRAQIIAWWDELVGIDRNDRIIGLGVNVPSVIYGTAAQQYAERVVNALVSHFVDVDALLLVSFRITSEGDPYVIELHADLGGDLIAEILLPTANPDFDFFKLALQVATRRVGEVKPIDFSPATLYYLRKCHIIAESSSETFPDYVISKRGSVLANLDMLSEAVNPQCLDLTVWPLHAEWSKLHASRDIQL